jgi:hypothetical protein
MFGSRGGVLGDNIGAWGHPPAGCGEQRVKMRLKNLNLTLRPCQVSEGHTQECMASSLGESLLPTQGAESVCRVRGVDRGQAG